MSEERPVYDSTYTGPPVWDRPRPLRDSERAAVFFTTSAGVGFEPADPWRALHMHRDRFILLAHTLGIDPTAAIAATEALFPNGESDR